MNRNGKDENPASINTVLIRCLQDSSTVPLRLMPAALRFIPVELRILMNAHDVATIRFGATKAQVGSATVASRSPTNVHDLAVVMRQVNRDVIDSPIHPERSRMATIPTTVPPRLSPISLRKSYDSGHAYNPPRFTTNVLNGCRGGSRIAKILQESPRY